MPVYRIEVPVGVPAQIQLCADVKRKATEEDGPSGLGLCHLCGSPDVLSGYLASAWSSPNRCSHSECERMEDLFPFYLLTLSALE